MSADGIARCRECHGAGTLPGPAICRRCAGAGRVVREPEGWRGAWYAKTRERSTSRNCGRVENLCANDSAAE
jgi:DnaJ-class molecular chaperone